MIWGKYNGVELNHLRYFYEVARLQSFTAAAKALRVSQPSVSKLVKQLEERQNVRLLDRNRRGGVRLTPVGQRFYASCQQIFGEIQNLTHLIAHEREECAGDLSIGASDNVCNYLLPEIFGPFYKRHPKVSLKLFSGTSEDIKKELLEGRVELGIFYAQPSEPQLMAESMGFVEFVIVTAGKRAVSFQELAELPFVGSRATDYSKQYPVLKMLNSVGVKPKTVIETNNQETQKRLALKGLGYTVVPIHMVRAEIAAGKARVTKLPKRIGSQLYLVTRKNKTLSKPALMFRSHLLAGK